MSVILSVSLSVCPSTSPNWNISAPTGWILIKFHISILLGNLWIKYKYAPTGRILIKFHISILLGNLWIKYKSAPTGRILIKFHISILLGNLWKKFKLHSDLTRTTPSLHEDQYKFVIISRSAFLEWETFQTKVVEKIWRHILCSITLFFSENRAVDEIMW